MFRNSLNIQNDGTLDQRFEIIILSYLVKFAKCMVCQDVSFQIHSLPTLFLPLRLKYNFYIKLTWTSSNCWKVCLQSPDSIVFCTFLNWMTNQIVIYVFIFAHERAQHVYLVVVTTNSPILIQCKIYWFNSLKVHAQADFLRKANSMFSITVKYSKT